MYKYNMLYVSRVQNGNIAKVFHAYYFTKKKEQQLKVLTKSKRTVMENSATDRLMKIKLFYHYRDKLYTEFTYWLKKT